MSVTPDNQIVGYAYLRTFPGILKTSEQVISLIGMICVVSVKVSTKSVPFIICSVLAIVLTSIFKVCYLRGVVLRVILPWYTMEFFYCTTWAIFYLIASCIVIAAGGGALITGGIFGLVATILYAVDAYHKFTLTKITT